MTLFVHSSESIGAYCSVPPQGPRRVIKFVRSDYEMLPKTKKIEFAQKFCFPIVPVFEDRLCPNIFAIQIDLLV